MQLRLDQLDRHAIGWMLNVVIKRIPAQLALTYRDMQMTVERLYQLFERLAERFPQHSSEKGRYGALFTVLYSDILTPEVPMDLEIGINIGLSGCGRYTGFIVFVDQRKDL